MAAIKVRSAITGTVSFFDVDDGDMVEKGDSIMSVECMKTMYPVVAPSTGKVKILVELGELVENDALVATIEVP